MWKNRAFRITIWTILGLLGVLIITTIICTILALQDNYADKYTIEKNSNSISISGRLIEAAWYGEDATVSDSDLNQWLSVYLNLPKETNGISLNHLAIHNHTDCTEAYFQITYNGFNLAFYSKSHLSVDTEQQKVYVEVQEMKIGELGVPNFLIGKVLTKALSSYDFLTIDGNTISFASSFNYNSVDIEVLELNAVENGLKFKTNELKKEAIQYIEETIKDWSEQAKNKWESIKDSFNEYIEKYLNDSLDKSQTENDESSNSSSSIPEASGADDIQEDIQSYVQEFKNEHADEISDIEEKLNELDDCLSEYWQKFKDSL